MARVPRGGGGSICTAVHNKVAEAGSLVEEYAVNEVNSISSDTAQGRDEAPASPQPLSPISRARSIRNAKERQLNYCRATRFQ